MMIFMLPEIYRDNGTFLERYLAIFSTIHEDMQRKIEDSAGLLECEKADAKLIRLYLGWLGLENMKAGLKEEEERLLLANLYWLNRRKGTRAAALRVAELLLGQEPAIMEARGEELLMIFREAKKEDEKQKFLAVVKQFLPAGLKVVLVCGKGMACCDRHAYLDLNGMLDALPEGVLDAGQTLGACMLGEERGNDSQ